MVDDSFSETENGYEFDSAVVLKDEDSAKKDKFNVPKFKSSSLKNFYDYENMVMDYESLEALNESIQKARHALFMITDKINYAERKEQSNKMRWERAHRRAYMKSAESSEGKRKAHADLVCEDLEDQYYVWTQVKNEFIRDSQTIRLELQTLQTLANNMRQQMKL